MISDIRSGVLAQKGLLSDDACLRAADLVAQVANSDLETIRVLFVDQHGILRGKTLVASVFLSVFTSGIAVPSTLLLKDTAHKTVFPVWSAETGIQSGPMQGANDVLLAPDPATFRPLPWAAHSAWIFCDVVYRDGTSIPFSSRSVLQKSIAKLAENGMQAKIGLEIEFNVFDRRDTTRPLNDGFQFLTETRYASAEKLLDALRRSAQSLNLPVRSVEIEMGPGQFEFTFDPDGPMAHANNMVMFRTMVKEICGGLDLHASFMAKPRVDGVAANGWHLHQSLVDAQTGRNLFVPGKDGSLTPQASGWIAGLLNHAAESSLLIAPTINSYKRYQPFRLAPDRIQWGHDNRGAMVRALMTPSDRASRIENRAPDTMANPFFAIAAQLICGMDGIMSGKMPPAPCDTPYDESAPALPRSLAAAIDAFETSSLFRSALGDEFVEYLVKIKRFEWDRYLAEISEWEQSEYFDLF